MTATPCAETQAQAVGLLALAGDDPERQRALAHARSCPACAHALAEADRVLALIDRALPLDPPRAAALDRARQEIMAELAGDARQPASSRTPPRSVLAGPALVGALLVASWLLLMAKHLGAGSAAVASASMALAAVAVTMVALTAAGWTAALLPAVSLLIALLPGSGTAGLQAATGVKCAVLELGLAVAPLVLTFLLVRRGLLTRPIAAVAVAAGGGALVGQSVLHVACHAFPSLGHTVVFHLLPVVLSLGLGAAVGARARAPLVLP